eukprot:3918353-Pyramimonas_sp.AAC.1
MGHQTAPLAACLQQQRLPPDTSSQCISKSRSRAGLRHTYKIIALSFETSSRLYTCGMAREQIITININMIVVVDVVAEFSVRKNNYGWFHPS